LIKNTPLLGPLKTFELIQINVLFDKKIHSTKQMMKKSISLLKKIILIKGYQVPFFGTFGPLVFKQVGLES
jgi:alpha-D-ribose 1-methylphosphonate 5-phosphate C-P lyase